MPNVTCVFSLCLGSIASGARDAVGPITASVARQAELSTFAGVQLSDKFVGSEDLAAKAITVALIVLMSITQFTSQHQAMTKNMPASAMDNPMFKQQKILLYVMPVVFAVSGINFPIGVLIYWLVTNLWSMGQQFYTIGRMPTPGSPADSVFVRAATATGSMPTGTAPFIAPDVTGDILDELVIVDSGSADGTLDVIRQLRPLRSATVAINGATQTFHPAVPAAQQAILEALPQVQVTH